MLIAKHQIAAVIEDTIGTAKAPSGSDVIETLVADFNQTRNLITRQPTSKSLSRGREYIGRGESSIPTEVDFKGSGTGTTAPAWGRLLRAAMLKEHDVVPLEFGVGQTLVAVRVGDMILDSATTPTKIAVVVEDTAAASDNVKVVVLQGTFALNDPVLRHRGYDSSGNRVTDSLGALDSVAVLGSAVGKAYVPYSRPECTFEITGSWGGAGTPNEGEVLSFTSGGVQVGQFSYISTSGTTITCQPIWGNVVASATIASTDGSTGTVSGTPAFAQTEGLRLSVYSNRDTLRRALAGAMFNYTLTGTAGESMRLAFEATGKNTDPTDTAFETGTSFSSQVPPRLTGDDGYAYIDGVKIPIKSLSHTPGNTVAMNPSAGESEGDQYAHVTGRDPELTLDVDQVGKGGFDWWEKWKNARPIQVGVKAGTAAGNTLVFCGTAAQVDGLADGDTDGIATHSVTMRLRAYLEGTGDDEFVIAHY